MPQMVRRQGRSSVAILEKVLSAGGFLEVFEHQTQAGAVYTPVMAATTTTAQNGRERGFPSRTSILVAAARAFGSREPDESVRNPDWLADSLIGPDELALISDHPLSKGLQQDYSEASHLPATIMFAWLMLLRTRFIDEALERAVKNGATQVVILGAGFDTRAYRFRDLLKHCRVIEADAGPTQDYKKRRVETALREVPPNLTYSRIDFASDNLSDCLHAAGLLDEEKTFYIWEGVCMYLPEDGVRKTLQIVASQPASGSSLVLDYTNSFGIEMARANQGPIAIPAAWGEPWVFGVPGADGSEFFRELGLDPGAPLSINSQEAIERYTLRRDGTRYGAHALQRIRAEAQARAHLQASMQGDDAAPQRASSAVGGVYWLAELKVPDRSRSNQADTRP